LTDAALAVYAVALACTAVVVWRRPVVALYVFIVGLALHNAVMDTLYGAGVHGHALTAIQAWKDLLLVVALARVAFGALRARRLPFRPLLVDALALAFAALVVLYALVPQHALDGHATHKAIAYALRHDLAGVGAYFLGRAVVPSLHRVRWLVLAAAAAVATWGLVDVYAIHLDWWRHNGTVGYFTKQLGYPYGPGLSHLPDNFVFNNGNEHELTRRLISTFLSPLAAAYLCVVGLLLAPRRRVALVLVVPAALGLFWTHTRAAVLALAVGLTVLAAVCRRVWPLVAAAATLAVGLAVIAEFPHIGPRAHFTPRELAYQRAHARRAGRTTLEPSTESHLSALRAGIRTVVHHPQGYGLGNAGEVAFREHVPLKAGESNYTEIGVEAGLLGALLFIAWNVALLAGLIRRREGALAAMLAAVLVVAIQTDAYGIPWLAYCVWWLAGSGLSLPRGLATSGAKSAAVNNSEKGVPCPS
jgi:O-antigen ligase/polysaccharide polymerase Wzy-like membrane protein